MSNFVAWNPYVASVKPPVVELFVSYGESTRIGRGSDAFVAGLMRDVGIPGTAATWTMTRFRSYYFTSYPDPGEDWRDRWPLVWRVRVELTAPPTALPRSDDGSFETEAVDETWRFDEDPTDAPARCLVVADFADDAAQAAARSEVTAATPQATMQRGIFLLRWPQLQIDLGEKQPSFYQEGAKEAEAIAALCRRHGATLRPVDTMFGSRS